MTIEEIKELLRLFNESGVGELELQRGENRLRIRKAELLTVPTPVPVIAAPAAAALPPVTSAAPPAAQPAKPVESESQQTLVKSPIVGTFYEASSPEGPPFVQVGDFVEVGQTLCIVEAMKLMNEIPAEVAGTVVAKLVENGRPVEYGEALFAIQPR